MALVVNPAAGAGGSADIAGRAAARLARRGVETRVIAGDSPDHARELIRGIERDREVDAVVVCGGDGMVSLVVQEIAGTDLPMGVVPAGSGNDFARDLGIPRSDTAAAADIVADGRVQRADVGVVTRPDGGRQCFATLLCAGFDSAVNRRVNDMEQLSGSLRYLAATASLYPNYRPRRYRMVFDDDEVVTTEVLLSAFGVTRYYGGGMQICPEADRTDGMLDVTWIGDVPRLRMIRQFPTVYRGRHLGMDGVQTRRCRKVTIEAEDVEAFADGDPVSMLPVTVEVRPAAIRYLVP